MKKITLLFLLLICAHSYAQNSNDSEKKAIKVTINQFFDCLKTQDTVLLKKTVLLNGQIWVANSRNEPSEFYTRFFKDDIKSFDPNTIFEEKPYSFNINVHKDMAMAWVPYEFIRNGKFSHCGVDIFTLLKMGSTWKIANVSYSVEEEGCKNLKSKKEF